MNLKHSIQPQWWPFQNGSLFVHDFLAQEQSPGMTWDDVVHYRLGIDDDGQTNERYMKAAGQSGIPTAFIVGRGGLIEWIGHPMRMDEPLRQVVDGTWDRT